MREPAHHATRGVTPAPSRATRTTRKSDDSPTLPA
jgi:hypothetical protein